MQNPHTEMTVVASLAKQLDILRAQVSELAKGMILIQRQLTLVTKAIRPIQEVEPHEATIAPVDPAGGHAGTGLRIVPGGSERPAAHPIE